MHLDVEWELLRARFALHRDEAYAMRRICAEVRATANLMRKQNQLTLEKSTRQTKHALRSFGSLPGEAENPDQF